MANRLKIRVKHQLRNWLAEEIVRHHGGLLQKILTDDRSLDNILSSVQVLNKILADDRLLDKILTSNQALNKILSSETTLDKILTDRRSIEKILSEHRLHSKLKAASARRIQKRLDYALPTFLVAFPRSGSNFLQSVLQGSSGFRCQSIYGYVSTGSEPLLSLKSHALSPEYLADEIHRIIPEAYPPSKIVLLHRDPRDVMISFFEYTQAQKNLRLCQEDFLEHVSYFYAATIDKTFSRRLNYAPLNIAEAYKKHVNTWFADTATPPERLVVKYEELLSSPATAFQHIFDFFQLDCPLSTEQLDTKVSLYSQTRLQRGSPQGWRASKERYAILLERMEALLGHEIQFLGYE